MDFQTLVNELRQRKTIPALSIQQPWAWFIVNGYKDVENRTWSTKFRGRPMTTALLALLFGFAVGILSGLLFALLYWMLERVKPRGW